MNKSVFPPRLRAAFVGLAMIGGLAAAGAAHADQLDDIMKARNCLLYTSRCV